MDGGSTGMGGACVGASRGTGGAGTVGAATVGGVAARRGNEVPSGGGNDDVPDMRLNRPHAVAPMHAPFTETWELFQQ